MQEQQMHNDKKSSKNPRTARGGVRRHSFLVVLAPLLFLFICTWFLVLEMNMSLFYDDFSGHAVMEMLRLSYETNSSNKDGGSHDENNDKTDYDDNNAYISALSTLSCFVTPRCFPFKKCEVGVPQKLQRRKRWEQQSFCVQDLVVARKKRNQNQRQQRSVAAAARLSKKEQQQQQQQQPCLVYSFGIHRSWDWEEKMAKIFGCEVHAFDPTMNHPKNLAPGVTFHKWGLQALGTNMSSNAVEYDAIDPKLLLSLPEIMQRLGHDGYNGNSNTQRTVDVLMMDCEGCEWGVLEHLACSGNSRRVKQIVTEFHFQKNLGLSTEKDVIHAAKAVQCLWRERWHVVSMEMSGAGRSNWEYVPDVASILHDPSMLLYVALERVPETEKRPQDLMLDYVDDSRRREVDEKLPDNPALWPESVRRNNSEAWSRYFRKVGKSKVEFDKWEIVVEKKDQ